MSKLIHRSKVVILEGRQRQEFSAEHVVDLSFSIETHGLLHAIVTRQEFGESVLVAGETRMKAIDMIWARGGTFKYNDEEVPEGFLPFVDLGELDELAAEECELDENLKRKDLTWQELAAAHDRLHKLRQKQRLAQNEKIVDDALAANKITEPLRPEQTVAMTAAEIRPDLDPGYATDFLRKEIIVAQHLDNPEVAKAKSVDEAFKLLRREEERKKNAELAAIVGASFTSASHKAFNVSCIEWMADPANAGQFDVILTDPPYGMGADQFGDGGGKLTGITHQYDDSYESWKTLMAAWAPLSFAVTKPQAHAYVFCDIDRFHELKAMMQAAGWYVFRTPFVVHKLSSGRVPLPETGPRRQYEILLYAIKGSKPVTHIYPDVIAVQGDENLSHGAQKPVALYQNLLQRSVRPGDKVLDSFAGSGTIFPACHTYKVEATGLEMNPDYYGICLKRLQELAE